MKLKDYVDNSIINYPLLYKTKSYEDSRLLVLNHIFLVIGNGLEWHKDGFIAKMNNRGRFITNFKRKKIPENFFSDKMWELNLLEGNVKEVKNALKGYYNYIVERRYKGNVRLVFLCNDEEFVNKIFEKYNVKDADEIEMDKFFKEIAGKERITKPNQIKDNDLDKCTPYPMCKYSAIVEMINKKNCSPFVQDFELNVQQDYIEGAIESAKWALAYYKNLEKIKNNMYHPNKALRTFKELYDKNPEKFRADRIPDGMRPEHTIEQWCQICWDKHLAEQVGYCEKFLEMYDKK